MDRFYWFNQNLSTSERLFQSVSGIRLYDGDIKTNYEDGKLDITNFKLLWRHSKFTSSLALDLSLIILVEEEQGGFTSSSKIILHLSPSQNSALPRPISQSKSTFIKLSFRQGGMSSFKKTLENALSNKEWESIIYTENSSDRVSNVKQLRTGILGIERSIRAKHKETDSNINKAFEDLKNLMDLAKEMVNLSGNITRKIKEQTGEISSDEAVQLRSYLLSLGVEDPVTKETVGSTTEYHRRLAQEICDVLKGPIEEIGGVMLLSEVYCRINRARGLHLLSPEDVLNACSLMTNMKLPLKLFAFNSGVQVLQLISLDESEVPQLILLALNENKEHGISAIELAHQLGIPLLLAQERLYHAERVALAVRDDSEEGLRFFPNLF